MRINFNLSYAAIFVMLLVTRHACGLEAYGDTQSFANITLDMAYSLAIQNSPDISLKNLAIAIQKKEYNLDIRSFLPKVSFSVNNSNSIRQNAPDSYEKNVSMKISQPIFQGGKVIYKRKLARARISLEKQNARQALYALIKKVWEQYFDVLQSTRTLELSKQTLDNLKKQAVIVEEQKRQGKMTEITYLQTISKIKTEEIAVKKQESELHVKRVAFARLIRIPAAFAKTFGLAPLNITHALVPISENMHPRFFALAKQANIDLKTKRIALEEVKFNLMQHKLQFVPSISLDFSGSLSGETFPLNNYQYSFGVTLQFANWGSPISSEGSFSSSSPTEYNTKESGNITVLQDMKSFTKGASFKLKKKQIEEEITQLHNTLEDNVQQQILRIVFQQEEYVLQKELIDIEEKKKAIFIVQAEQGILTPLKLVDYLLEYQKRKTALITAEFSLAQALRTLEFTLGLYQGHIGDIL